MELQRSSHSMSDLLAITDWFNGGAAREILLPPLALRRNQPRGDVDGVSPSSLYRKSRNGRIAVTLAAFVSVAAIVFLVSSCIALSGEVLPQRVGRRLAEEQESKGDWSGSTVQQACEGIGSQSSTATRRRGRSPDPLGEGPPPKKRQEELDGQDDIPQSSWYPVEGVSEPTGAQMGAEELRQSILRYVEQTLAERDEGLEADDWELYPFWDMQLPDEEEPTQLVSTVGSAAAGTSAESDASESIAASPLFPEEGIPSSAAQGIEFPSCSNVSLGTTAPSSDAQFPSQGAITAPSSDHLHPVETISRRTLLEYVVGQPGAKGAYALLGSEISVSQGSSSLILAYSPLPGESASQQRPGDVGTHPFYRLPSVKPNASVREIDLSLLPPPSRKTFFDSKALLGVRNLLKRPLLDPEDLELLMRHLEQLIKHAASRAKECLNDMEPRVIVERLAFALLQTDAIYAASEVLGPQAKRSEWWQEVIATLPVYTGSESTTSRANAQQNIILARFLLSALEYYRCGARPPAEVLVPLKQVLLCAPAVAAFRRWPWTQFATDDTEWQQSQ